MRARKAAVAGAVVIAAVAVLGYAQQPGFTRKLLQDQNLSVPERHAVQALAEFVPGGAAGRHTLKAGDAFFVEAGKVHDGRNVGSGAAKVLVTYIVEKGKPVASPAK